MFLFQIKLVEIYTKQRHVNKKNIIRAIHNAMWTKRTFLTKNYDTIRAIYTIWTYRNILWAIDVPWTKKEHYSNHKQRHMNKKKNNIRTINQATWTKIRTLVELYTAPCEQKRYLSTLTIYISVRSDAWRAHESMSVNFVSTLTFNRKK